MSSSQFSDWSRNFDLDGLMEEVLSSAKADSPQLGRLDKTLQVQGVLQKFTDATAVWRGKERVIASVLIRLATQGYLKRRGVGFFKRYLAAMFITEGANAMLYPGDYAEYRAAVKVLQHDLKQVLVS